MIHTLLAEGVEHLVVLMRHSARDFHTDRHDLENQLTEEGRELSVRLGKEIPKAMLMRAYSSPAQRCIDTAELALQGHADAGGEVARNRVIEALGVFYVLDQMRMFMAMRDAGGMLGLLTRWFSGEVATDIMMPPDLAATMIADLAARKLKGRSAGSQMDLLCTHDLTLYTLRDRLLGQSYEDVGEVDFLDCLAIYEDKGQLMIKSHHGPAVPLKLS